VRCFNVIQKNYAAADRHSELLYKLVGGAYPGLG